MARFAILFTVVFLLFSFSHARFLTVEPGHDVTSEETVTDSTEFDPETSNAILTSKAILLPSERSGFEPSKIADFKHDDASETESDVGSVPLTRISFHPVNRHFPRRPLLPFRHKHNCRFHRRFRPLNPQFQQKRYISYGDDMILSDERTRFDPMSDGAFRQIQARWARFPDDGAESKEHVDFMKPHHHDHDHEQDHDHDHDHDHDEDHHHRFHHYHRRHHHGEVDERDEEEEHEGGFMRRLSKFFIHF